MNTPTQQDQYAAAVADARQTFTTALGLPADHQATRGSSPFLDELLDRYCTPTTPRCPHLQARPVQPWLMTLPYAQWRCRPCATTHALATAGRWLGDVEESTCDRCRQHKPSETLTPALLRQDLWVVVASLCAACTAHGQRHGAQVLGGQS